MQETRERFGPWVKKMPWKRAWQPIPVSLPGEFRGQRSLAGYSPWGCKESDRGKQLSKRAEARSKQAEAKAMSKQEMVAAWTKMEGKGRPDVNSGRNTGTTGWV